MNGIIGNRIISISGIVLSVIQQMEYVMVMENVAIIIICLGIYRYE